MIFQLKTKTKCHKDEECKDMAQILKLLSCFLYIFLPLLCFLESTPSTPLLLPFLFCPFSACCWLNSALCSIFWGRTLVAGPSWRCPSAANSTPRGQGVQRGYPEKRESLEEAMEFWTVESLVGLLHYPEFISTSWSLKGAIMGPRDQDPKYINWFFTEQIGKG